MAFSLVDVVLEFTVIELCLLTQFIEACLSLSIRLAVALYLVLHQAVCESKSISSEGYFDAIH